MNNATPAAVPTKPLLKPWYRLAEHGGGVVLEYGGAAVRLDGAATHTLLPVLLPLLDGSRTVDEIVETVGRPVRPAVEAALALLSTRGLLAEGACDDGRRRDMALFLAAASHGTPTPAELADRLRARMIAVAGHGRLAAEIGRVLRAVGADVERRSWSRATAAELVVAAPSSRELPRLERWNASALRTGTTWLHVGPYDGWLAAIGPLFVPGETCCYACYRLRRKANVPFPDEFDAVESRPLAIRVPLSVDAAVAGLAATLAVRWLTLRDHALPGCMYGLELGPVFSLQRHVVHRVPRCPSCSGLDGVAPPLPWYKEVRAEIGA
jgi:bacteriocin biosynthesis cyclodehydratase domain-containing protein